MDFVIFKQLDIKNRAYVIDLKGNKLFYGSIYQCKKFIDFMRSGGGSDAQGKIIERAAITGNGSGKGGMFDAQG